MIKKIFKNKKTIDIIIYISSCLLWIVGIYQFYSNPNIYPRIFHSDNLFFPSLYKDIFEDGFDWYGWSLPAAPNYFPDLLLYFIIAFFTKLFTNNFIYSMVLHLVIKQIIILFGFIYLLEAIFINVSSEIKALIILTSAFILILLINNINGTLLITYLTTLYSHSGAFINSLFSLNLILRLFKKEKMIYYFILFILCFLAILSDRIFFVYLIFPISFTLIIFYVFNYIKIQVCAKIILNLIISSLMGIFIHKYITIYPLLQYHYFIFSIERFTKSLTIFLKDLIFLFHKRDLITFSLFLWNIITLLLIFIITIVYTKSISKLKQAFNVQKEITLNFLSFTIYLMIMSPMVIISPIIMGIYRNMAEMRYFLAVTCFSLFAWSFLICFIFQFLKIKNKWRKTFVFFCILVLLFFFIKNWQKSRKISIFEYYPLLTQCLDAHTKEYKLSFGISNCRDAKLNTIFSKRGLRIYQVDDNLQPYHILNNIEWYNGKPSSRYPNPSYNFVICETAGAVTIKKEKVIAKFGTPAASFKCEGAEILVYNRKSDVKFRNQFRYNLRILLTLSLYKLRHKGGTIIFPAVSLFSHVGQIIGENRIANEGKDKAGYLIYGPYICLKRGIYKLILTYSTNKATRGLKIGQWDISFYNNKILKRGFITATGEANEKNIVISISITNELENVPLEFRVFYLGKGVLKIKELKIERIF